MNIKFILADENEADARLLWNVRGCDFYWTRNFAIVFRRNETCAGCLMRWWDDENEKSISATENKEIYADYVQITWLDTKQLWMIRIEKNKITNHKHVQTFQH